MWNTKKKIQELKQLQWRECQLIHDEISDLYEEVSALSYQLERLKESKDDLPRVSQSRGCIKIIL
jgi:hypothetical protein